MDQRIRWTNIIQRIDAKMTRTIEITPELESFCRDYITVLAIHLDVVIRIRRKEHESAFNAVMDSLSSVGPALARKRNPFQFAVRIEDRQQLLTETKLLAEAGGIPYNRLAPLNQFLVTIPAYLFYCLENYLQDAPDLQEEARRLMNTEGFRRYLQEELGYPISQRIGGAFRTFRIPWFKKR